MLVALDGLRLPVLRSGTPELPPRLAALADRGEADFGKVEEAVRAILGAVKTEGDAAVLRFVREFEKRTPSSLVLRDYGGEAALARLAPEARDALAFSVERVAAFHQRERDVMFGGGGFRYEEDGVTLGLRVRPLRRVGVYAPGGKARYPSSVVMAAVPAKVAGVADIVLATPLAGDASDDVVLAAAHLSGVTAVVDAGGAQAIAALAYGTALVPRVDKIVGPGNLYVACAKRLVYGAVAIDSIAGPSEILVVADAKANPAHVAADLLSQAEHDEDAYALLVTDSEALVSAVEKELAAQLAALPRKAIASESIRRHALVFLTAPGDRAEMARIASVIAAEHLALHVDDAWGMLDGIPDAGAAFVGRSTPEAAGDYLAGPSHVLPTGGAVRFGSPLGVHDFVARTSTIAYTPEALRRHAPAITALARLEGLEAHARAVTLRTEG